MRLFHLCFLLLAWRLTQGEEEYFDDTQRAQEHSNIDDTQVQNEGLQLDDTQAQKHVLQVDETEELKQYSQVDETEAAESENSYVDDTRGQAEVFEVDDIQRHEQYLNVDDTQVQNEGLQLDDTQAQKHVLQVDETEELKQYSQVDETESAGPENSYVDDTPGQAEVFEVDDIQRHEQYLNVDDTQSEQGYSHHVDDSRPEQEYSQAVDAIQGQEEVLQVDNTKREQEYLNVDATQAEQEYSHVDATQGQEEYSHVDANQGQEEYSHVDATQGQEEYSHVVDTANEMDKNEQENAEVFGQQFNMDMAHSLDSIQILGLPSTQSTSSFRPKISYSVAGPRILVVDVFAIGIERMKHLYHTEWTEISNYGEARLKIAKVNLPDRLVYRENKAMNLYPDLHTEYILVRASILDFNNPSNLIQQAEQSLKLIPPWSRVEKKGYSCSWKGMILKKYFEIRIPQCPKVNDVVELLSFPAAMIKTEHGYKKFFKNLRQPELEKYLGEEPNVIPQFTVTTWLYLTKRCSNHMCPLMHHVRGSTYLTPLVGLLQSGHLHIQVQYKDESGYAFLIEPGLPLQKWVHLAMIVKGTVVTFYIRHGKNLEHTQRFVHTDFPDGLFHYNDTDGYWILGGTPGFASPEGFIGPARIYRRRVLAIETIEKLFPPASKPNLGISNYYSNCRKLKSKVKALLKKENIEKNLCPARQWSSNGRNLSCRVGVTGIAAEIVHVSEIWQNATGQVGMIQDNVYNYAIKIITTGPGSPVKDALNYLAYSSCLGHSPSLYMTSVIYRTGFKTTVDTRRATRALLIGALNNHPLSQMSLAYKHLIGVDGFPEDRDVAQTYYRHAADQSNQQLSQHNEVHTHSEAVRLDKKDDLDNYRGPNSNWFNWLKHQAKRGLTDAQSALGEMFYYGARGFRRNLTKAAEFYKMGANNGDAQMLFNLGVIKLRGQGVTVDEDEARELFIKSSDLGFASAFNALGYYELHVRKNKSGAVHYFKRAADNGDRDGMYNLGSAYEHGLAPGSTPDLKLAVSYYIDAATKGHPGGCIEAGDAFSKGKHVDRNTHLALIYFKFIADQIPEMGAHLRHGLDEYFAGAWYKSVFYYMLAAEAGMEVAQYNMAMLCEWDWGEVSKYTEVDCVWRYFNHSAKLQWTPSMVKTGDNYWYGITIKKNITAATQLYSEAASKEQNPQAIYNLGYLVENNYPLDGLMWLHFHPSNFNQGNLSLAAVLYRKCRDSSDEALLPCSIGLLRVAVKMAWKFQFVNNEILLIPSIAFIMAVGLLFCICRINSGNEAIDIA